LGAEGTEVITSSDPLRGRELVPSTQPDLILVDLDLPPRCGVETITHLRSALPWGSDGHTPIIALSSDISHEQFELALAAGCDGFIAKPVDVDGLVERIGKYHAGERDRLSPSREKAALIGYHRSLVMMLETKTQRMLLDTSTDLYSEQYLYTCLEKEASRTLRFGIPFSIVLMHTRIHFPEGQEEADSGNGSIHRAIADIIRANKRSFDPAHRMTGDAYCLVLGGCAQEHVVSAGERISRQVVLGVPVRLRSDIRIEISFGVNTHAQGPIGPLEFVRLAQEVSRPFSP